jgi:site-specific DNA-methyltransferase (adenine-specific)
MSQPISVQDISLQTITSINITKNNYQFVPLQDFSKPWTDEELYRKYNLTNDEIAFIESMIRPME